MAQGTTIGDRGCQNADVKERCQPRERPRPVAAKVQLRRVHTKDLELTHSFFPCDGHSRQQRRWGASEPEPEMCQLPKATDWDWGVVVINESLNV
jgi:hypothetical protein